MKRGHLAIVVTLVAVLVAGVALLSGLTSSTRTTGEALATAPPAPQSADPAARWPGWGFTHTQYSADSGAPSAVRSVQEALAEQPMVQAQAIMGWGAGNPNPEPGRYDFRSLDQRIEFIRDSGGIPVITLCCAPDWMKGGEAGQTDWSELETAPLPEHFSDFADLAGVVASRYPDVQHFMVWNEFKGFWDEDANVWDAVGYTDFYNQVHEAVKAVNPDALIGGPYLSMVRDDVRADGTAASTPLTSLSPQRLEGEWGSIDPRVLDAFEYWLRNNRGADFIVIDGHAVAREGITDPFSALPMFSAVNEWIGERTDLPIWWAEWYLDPVVRDWTASQQIAVQTAAMIEFARGGTDTVLYWNPEPQDASCGTCLWTTTTRSGGGQPLSFLEVIQGFSSWFPPGTELEDVAVPPGLQVLAQAQAAVVVNTTNQSISADIRGERLTLGPYAVRWVTTL